MHWLKQSTAATVKLGPFVDSTDGVTAETALTISQADIRLSKNGGDVAQSSNSAGATHDELGYYDVPLDATDTDTLGRLDVIVSESGALPVFRSFMVLPANVYDSLFSTDRLQVDVVESSTPVAVASVTGAVGSVTGNVGGNVAGSVGSVLGGINTSAGTITTLDGLDTAQDAQHSATQSAIADVPTVAEFEARTIASASYATAAALATVDGNVDLILEDTGTTIPATLAAIQGATFDTATDSLEALRNRGDAAWATATGFSTLDAAGVRSAVGLASANLDAQLAAIVEDTGTTLPATLGTLATASALATVDTVVDAILADTGTDGVVVASGSKSGYSLASTGLDAISVTPPAGVATTFPGMVVQVWRRFFKRATKSATQIITYADDNTTAVTTQAISASGSDEVQGAAS